MLKAQSCKVGLVRFKSQIDSKEVEELTEQSPLQLYVKEKEWDMKGRHYHQMANNTLFDLIQEVDITSITLRWGVARLILHQIKDISFPKLQELNLNGNKITSIEALPLIKCTSLRVLNLKGNDIRSIRPFKKCLLPELKELSLYGNAILDFTPLSQLMAPKLQMVWTVAQCDSLDCQDGLSWMFTLQSKIMKRMYVHHTRGVILNYGVIQDAITNRYSNLKLNYQMRDDINLRRLD